MDFFDFTSMSDTVDDPKILQYFCPNCGELICNASDEGLFDVRNKEVFQYLIVIKDGKVVGAGKYWKEKFGLRFLCSFPFFSFSSTGNSFRYFLLRTILEEVKRRGWIVKEGKELPLRDHFLLLKPARTPRKKEPRNGIPRR